jgi:hypothetical protein
MESLLTVEEGGEKKEEKERPENKRKKKTKGKQGERTYLTLKARVWPT